MTKDEIKYIVYYICGAILLGRLFTYQPPKLMMEIEQGVETCGEYTGGGWNDCMIREIEGDNFKSLQ